MTSSALLSVSCTGQAPAFMTLRRQRPFYSCTSSTFLKVNLRSSRNVANPAACVVRSSVKEMPQLNSHLIAMPVLVATALASAYILLYPSVSRADQVIEGPARAVDGDTLVIGKERIRLYGVDAPEKSQVCQDPQGQAYGCGSRSAEFLAAEVGDGQVKCVVKDTDMYGRNVASCSNAKGQDLGAALVSDGYAVAYRQYSKDYIPLEEAARTAHKGIWNGNFQMPSEYRKQVKAGAAAGAVTVATIPSTSTPLPVPVSCPGGAPPIKGNIGSSGEKIYHVPGGRSYNSVKISIESGEQYFCSAAEAEARGWRAAAN